MTRRGFLAASAGAATAPALASVPAQAVPRPFGRYGTPARRLTPDTLYVDPHGRHAQAPHAAPTEPPGRRRSPARQYYAHCHVEGDVDFVFGRATAVFDRCRFRTLNRTDLAAAPYGFVFAPSTAAANPRGFLVTHARVTSGAPDAAYKPARPWVPGSDPTARPMLTVRDTWLGPGIDAVAPYTDMSAAYPWQNQRFAEYRDTGPGAVVAVPENRPQLDAARAGSGTPAAYLGDWTPGRKRRRTDTAF
ncbi:pectinesterase family protein [Streptomyces sp. NPDC001811]